MDNGAAARSCEGTRPAHAPSDTPGTPPARASRPGRSTASRCSFLRLLRLYYRRVFKLLPPALRTPERPRFFRHHLRLTPRTRHLRTRPTRQFSPAPHEPACPATRSCAGGSTVAPEATDAPAASLRVLSIASDRDSPARFVTLANAPQLTERACGSARATTTKGGMGPEPKKGPCGSADLARRVPMVSGPPVATSLWCTPPPSQTCL